MDRRSEVEVFVTVVEQGAVTAAARKLGLSKSYVSKQVKALEERLGVRLLHRTSRALSLSSSGKAFFERAAAALEELDAAEAAVVSQQVEAAGTLRVTAPVSFGLRHLLTWLPTFQREHPAVALDVSLSDRVVDLVDEGFDVAIRAGGLAPSSLVARRLAPMRLWLVASPGFVGGRPAVLAPEDLQELPVLRHRQGESWSTLRLRDADGEEQLVRVTGPMVSDNGDVLAAAAMAGLGVALMPDFLVGAEVASGALVRVLPGWEGPRGGVHAVYPHRRHLSARVRVFVDALAAHLADPPWARHH